MIIEEDVYDLVYDWKWGPNNDGYGIIKTDKYHLVKVKIDDLNLQDSYLIQYGIPKLWKIDSIAESDDIESLITKLYSDNDSDDLFYDDTHYLGEKERLIARKFNLSVFDISLINFYRLVANKNPKIIEHQDDILEDLVDDEYFSKSIALISDDDPKFVTNFLQSLDVNQKHKLLYKMLVRLSNKVTPKYGLDRFKTTVLQIYLSLHPTIPKPSVVKDFDVNPTINKFVTDYFVQVLVKVGKHLGLIDMLLYSCSELIRIKILKQYVRYNWEKLVGLN